MLYIKKKKINIINIKNIKFNNLFTLIGDLRFSGSIF